MACVEPESGHRAWPHQGSAVRCHGSQSGPELGAADIAPFWEKIPHHHGQGVVTLGIECQIEARQLRHATDPDPLIEAGDGHLVGFIQNCTAGRRVGIRHGQGQGVTFDRIDGQIDPKRTKEAGSIAAQGADNGIGLETLLTGSHRHGAPQRELNLVDGAVEDKFHPEFLRLGGQGLGEAETVAGFISRQAQAAHYLATYPCQCRFNPFTTTGIQ